MDNRPNLVGKSRAAVDYGSDPVGSRHASDARDLTLRSTLGGPATRARHQPIALLRGASGRPSAMTEDALLRGYGLDPDTLDPIR